MNYVEEAFGITRAAQSASSPVAISFTVETDDNLSTGQTRKDAIVQVGQATENAPAYYMINRAHPTPFASILASGESWVETIRGRRAKVKFEIFSVINKDGLLKKADHITTDNCSNVFINFPFKFHYHQKNKTETIARISSFHHVRAPNVK